MKNILSILIITIMTFTNIYSQTNQQYSNNTNNVNDILLWQSIFGLSGTIVGGICGILISNGIQDISRDASINPWYRDVLSHSMLTIGAAVSVTIISSINGYNGSFWCSLLGAAIGTITLDIIVFPMMNNRDIFPTVAINIVTGILLLAPTVGAIMGYNLSLPNNRNIGIININNDSLCINIPKINIYTDKYEIYLFNINY